MFAMRRAAAIARSRVERARPPLYAFTLTRRGVVGDEGEGETKAPSHQATKKGPAAIPSQPAQSVRVAFKATDPSHTALWKDVRCKKHFGRFASLGLLHSCLNSPSSYRARRPCSG